MRALVLNGTDGYAIEERPMPEPDTGEVLFRTHYSGICGTDLHAIQFGRYEDGVVIGHEFAGEVVSAGPGVDGWQAGDRAAVHPKGNVCGACPECRAGYPNMCSATNIGGTAGIGSNGGMAAYVSVPAGKLRRLPDEVSLQEGAWVEPTAVALRGVTRSGFKVGRRAVVIGAGPIGLLCVMHLRLGGASHITVLEPSELRRAKAEELGADITIDPLTDDPTEIFGNDIERPTTPSNAPRRHRPSRQPLKSCRTTAASPFSASRPSPSTSTRTLSSARSLWLPAAPATPRSSTSPSGCSSAGIWTCSLSPARSLDWRACWTLSDDWSAAKPSKCWCSLTNRARRE